MSFVIDLHERICSIGRTGCGKTEHAKYFLREISKTVPVVILDPKEDWLGQFPIWETKRKEPGTIDKPHLVKKYNPKFHVQVLQPHADRDEDVLDNLATELLKLRNKYVYCDETVGLCTATFVPEWMKKIWQTGRSRGIGAWAATQTPSGFPRILKSQAEKFFTFMVGAQDIDIAAEIGNATKEDVKMLKRFEFLFFHTNSDMEIAEWNAPIPFKEKVLG